VRALAVPPPCTGLRGRRTGAGASYFVSTPRVLMRPAY
jgi:hypothetical protein